MVETYDIYLPHMMENAGRAAPATLARGRFLGRTVAGRSVTILVSSGGNGGEALTLALDAPSGFDASSGTLSDDTICTLVTLILALPKRGLDAEVMRHALGDLYIWPTFRCRVDFMSG